MATRDPAHVPGRETTPIALDPEIDPRIASAIKTDLPAVAERTVARIIAEVPSYAGALTGPMGETIRGAVQLALGGFLSLATRSRGSDPGTPLAPALEGAYRLGRGEAIAGRSMEALLAAYRIGARTAWRDLARTSVAQGASAEELATFAELVFAYIDELSAASVAGHSAELESSSRARARHLERLTRALLDGSPADAVVAAAQRAEWEPPAVLTAVVLPDSHLAHARAVVDPRSLLSTDDPLADDLSMLLVAGSTASRSRRPLLRALADERAVVGPSVPWLEVATSAARAGRFVTGIGMPAQTVDTDERLAELVVHADPAALADLRARVLAPLSDLRPAAVEKLTATLRSWLLHQGRRDPMAEDLYVHPQTVRYRVTQLREAYGERLDAPDFVRDATVALAATSPDQGR